MTSADVLDAAIGLITNAAFIPFLGAAIAAGVAGYFYNKLVRASK